MKIIEFIKKEFILVVATILMIISCFIIGIDKAYLDYIDYNTLLVLFSLMLVVDGFKLTGIFDFTANKLLKRIKTERALSLVLILLSFFTSMFITNDVALIMFVPFAIIVLKRLNLSRNLGITIVLMTVAANLGSMLLPIGNPQNLYLFNISNLKILDFILLMLPYALFSLLLLVISTIVCLKRTKILEVQTDDLKVNKRIYLYLVLFLLVLLSVINIIPKYAAFIIVSLVMLIFNRSSFKRVDYNLLLTFIVFFIFVGNMNRVASIKEAISNILVGHEILLSIGFSQVISNVPAAILLSNYTNNYELLLIGTNIGGLGTLIASMASLISFKLYTKEYKEERKSYFLKFSLVNIIFLILLFSLTLFII